MVFDAEEIPPTKWHDLILKALKYKYKEDILEKFLSEVLFNSFRGRYMEPLIDKKGILNMENINNLILQIKKIYLDFFF